MNSTDPNNHKAKSRISVDRKVILVEPTSHTQNKNKSSNISSRWISRVRQPLTHTARSKFDYTTLVSTETLKTKLPSLSIAGLLLFILVTIFTTVSPQSVANTFFYQSYLPVLLVYMLCIYFFCRAVLATARYAVYCSLFLTLLLFLKLQSVELEFLTILVPLLFFVLFELILKLVIRK